MKVIICTNTTSLETSLAHQLISKGITTIKIKSLDEIYDSIPFISRICFIDESCFDQKLLSETIKNIKKNEAKKGCRIILLTKYSDTETINNFIKNGVDVILQSSLHRDTIAKKFTQFVDKISQQDSRRKYIRIQLDQKEEATIKFLLPLEKNYAEGKITDISMGGIAAVFSKGLLLNMKENTIYPRSQIKIDHRIIFVDIKLVKKGKDMLAFCFQKLQDSFKDILAEYIYSKIQKYMSGDY